MRLKLYRAGSVPEAMALVRRDLGAEALILSTRRVGQGVELTAALEVEDELPTPPPDVQAASIAASSSASLAWHGLPAALIQRLGSDNLGDALASLLHFATLKLDADAAPLLLVGSPGAGKTLTVARLATRLVLAGTTPLVITTDGRRAAAAEQLAAYTRLLGLDLVVAGQAAALGRALQRHRVGTAAATGCVPSRPVLIDSTGVNPFDPVELDGLKALARAAAATVLLVMPAGQDPLEAAEHAACFAEAGARYLLPTRLDMTRRLGSVVTAAIAGDLMLTDAGTGPGAADGLTPLTPQFLAARLAQTTATPDRLGGIATQGHRRS